MIDIKKLVGKIKEVGDSEKAIIPMVQQKYIEKCGEDHAIIVVKNDIVDKVLLRDLPSLYGIRDVQELNRFFTYLAYNSGN